MDQQPEWLSLEETAAALKVGQPTVQSLINRGLIATEPGSDPPRVSYQAVLEFLRDNQRALLDEDGQPPDLGLITGADDAS